MKKNSSMIFYVLAIIFLIITVFIAVNNYQTLSRSAADYGISLGDEWVSVLVSVISASFGFLGFSCVLYGIGKLLNQLENNYPEGNTKKQNK